MTDAEGKAKKAGKSAVGIFFEEVSRSSLIVPILAIFSGLVLGGVIVALSSKTCTRCGPYRRFRPSATA